MQKSVSGNEFHDTLFLYYKGKRELLLGKVIIGIKHKGYNQVRTWQQHLLR